MTPTIRAATPSDVSAIARVLRANANDDSLFQQEEHQIRADVGSFRVAELDKEVVGSAALIRRSDGRAEILGVGVAPGHQGRGVGSALIATLVDVARREGVALLWLGTAKPEYFARFGFERMSRWRLPVTLLLYKLRLVFGQRAERWIPAVFGHHVFMRHASLNDGAPRFTRMHASVD
jgi:N-acetylglutamate synthase-like GNAT family acetyltransferase